MILNVTELVCKIRLVEKLEQELTDLKKNLEEIPLFVEYNQNLEIVNDMIDTVKEQLNDYFKEKLNILK